MMNDNQVMRRIFPPTAVRERCTTIIYNNDERQYLIDLFTLLKGYRTLGIFYDPYKQEPDSGAHVSSEAKQRIRDFTFQLKQDRWICFYIQLLVLTNYLQCIASWGVFSGVYLDVHNEACAQNVNGVINVENRESFRRALLFVCVFLTSIFTRVIAWIYFAKALYSIEPTDFIRVRDPFYLLAHLCKPTIN